MNQQPNHDDWLEARLRRALNAEAEMVQTQGDGLQKIRAGIDARDSRRWWRHPAVALVAAATLGVVAGGAAVALGQGGGGQATVPAAPTKTQPTTGPEPSEPPGSSEPPSDATSGPATPAPKADVAVFVYYLHDDGNAPRLYREQHAVPLQAHGRVASAVAEMFGDLAVDPDYESAWPTGTKVLGYSRSGDTATVDLSDFPSVGAQFESVSVQQLVYTVTANDPAVKKVRLLVDGQTPPSGHADWSQPVARAAMLDVQGLVWILAPAQRATVGSPVKVVVHGTAFEGNVILRVLRHGQEVRRTFVTTSMGEFVTASTSVRLPPGTYRIVAYDENARDGSLIERDSKRFFVR